MNQKFNKYNIHETPLIRLCNPNGKTVNFLGGIYNIKLSLCFNEMSQLTFTVPSYIDNEKYIPYNQIQTKRYINVENIGVFIVNDISETNDGYTPIKTVTCYSREAELNFKKVNIGKGTYKFYDILNPEGTLLDKLLKICPNWKIGQIDTDLLNKYRTFEVPDSTLYQFLMTDVENAYECVFIFDTLKREVSAIKTSNINKKTDILLSFNNLLKNVKIDEMSDEIVTCLKVYGGGDLDIRAVNPLGTESIYDFSHYMTKDKMSEDLIKEITLWKAKIELNLKPYADLLSSIKTNNLTLLDLNSELTTLNNEWLDYEAIQKVRIEQRLDISDVNALMSAKQSQIDNKKNEIENLKNKIKLDTESKVNINKSLSFENNFTESQYLELNDFMYENTYQNDSFIRTTTMTEVEIQNMAEELYEQGKSILQKSAQPRYSFSLESVNFIYLPEYKKFTNQLELGTMVNVRLDDDNFFKPILLKIEYDLDNPINFTLTFGNRFRLEDSEYIFSDLFSDAIKGGTSVKFDGQKWSDWIENSRDNVTEFIDSALDTSKNNLINAKNQEIIINQNGLKGRTANEDGTFKPTQCWLTSETLAYTKDNWQTASLALGQIEYNNQKLFGLVCDALVGKIVAGNQLQISNSKNNFILDENGAYLQNAKFVLEGNDGKSKITLDPTIGIKIQGRANTSSIYSDRMYMDSVGNLIIKGSIEASSGNIGGWSIASDGLINNNNGDYLKSNGNYKLGMLTMTPTSATFHGKIFAENLNDGGITSNKLSNGSITTSKYAGGSISSGALGNRAVTPAKLDRTYATIGQFDELYANKANIADVVFKNATSQIISCSSSLQLRSGGKMYLSPSSAGVRVFGSLVANSLNAMNGANTSFTTLDGKRVTVSGGIITSVK